jgi:hypothetical protein
MTGRAPPILASLPSRAPVTVMTLKRRLGLPLLVLYGTGITIGAGIYVLIGTVAGHAGVYAPWSFLLAAAIMALTVASYIELCTRFPVSAGEAAYVKAAFESRSLSILVGFLTIGIATVSSAAVALGAAGYIQQFLDWPRDLIVVAVVVLLGGVAAARRGEHRALCRRRDLLRHGARPTQKKSTSPRTLPARRTIAQRRGRKPARSAIVPPCVGFARARS